MMDFALLIKLQRELRSGAETLAQLAETDAMNPLGFAYFQIVADCIRLERDISALTADMLEGARPGGIC